MAKRLKLEPKDAAAIEEFVGRLRAALDDNIVEVNSLDRKRPATTNLIPI
jgi:hypothetical protein